MDEFLCIVLVYSRKFNIRDGKETVDKNVSVGNSGLYIIIDCVCLTTVCSEVPFKLSLHFWFPFHCVVKVTWESQLNPNVRISQS